MFAPVELNSKRWLWIALHQVRDGAPGAVELVREDVAKKEKDAAKEGGGCSQGGGRVQPRRRKKEGADMRQKWILIVYMVGNKSVLSTYKLLISVC